MKALDRPFMQIINGASQFVIPVFQRDYAWQEPQCAQLWRDVMRASAAPGPNGHFLGSIVYSPTGDNQAGFTRWLLIDGQQRLTTLTLLLAALRDHIRASHWVGGEESPTEKKIEAYFLKNAAEDGDRKHKLVLRRHDQETLQNIIDCQEVPENYSERISENYSFLRRNVENSDPDVVYKGISRLVVVDVTLDPTRDNPQLIFESLNSTGVDLTQSDLVRNFMLMCLPEREQTKMYNQYWSKIDALYVGSPFIFDNFIRDYVALTTKTNKQETSDQIYYAFRDFFPKWIERNSGLENALSDMLRHSRHYAAFALGKGVSGERARRLMKLRQLVDAPAILLMRLIECFDYLHAMTESEFLEAVTLIESFVLRRAVCGFQTRGYWQIFSSIAYKIGVQQPLVDLKVGLALLRDTYRFPTDIEFGRALEERNLYDLRVCRPVLDGLENFDTKEPSDTKAYTIEHIMPQNPNLDHSWKEMLGQNFENVQKTWLHRLGNLTLTGYNSEYSDKRFDEKKIIKGGFSDSAIRLNKFVREQPVWNEQTIRQRTIDLSRCSLKVWGPLSVAQDQIDAAKIIEKRELEARGDVRKVEMSATARELFNQIREKIRALDKEMIEISESNSISYHSPSFFLEVLPRQNGLTLLLDLQFSEIDDQTGLAEDASQQQFFVHAKHQGGVAVKIWWPGAIEKAMPLIRMAYAAANT